MGVVGLVGAHRVLELVPADVDERGDANAVGADINVEVVEHADAERHPTQGLVVGT
ncbi:unannotated protein [freshwater metagenome]|uniref:Unannotated protein n=1 Tax=freshwater metagenome TaxID=449393 RepID=A0A6J7RGJ9_9ZZZZ